SLTFLKQLPPGSKLAVLDTAEFGAQPVDVSQAESLITSRQIQTASRPITDCLKEAFRLLEAEKAKSSTEETLADLPLIVCVFSDRTKASWNADTVSASLRAGKKRLEERLGRAVPFLYIDFRPPPAPHVA